MINAPHDDDLKEVVIEALAEAYRLEKQATALRIHLERIAALME